MLHLLFFLSALAVSVVDAAVSPLVTCGASRSTAFNLLEASTAVRTSSIGSVAAYQGNTTYIARHSTNVYSGWIERMTTSGSFMPLIGTPEAALSNFNASSGTLSKPGALTVDASGSRLFFIDNSNVYVSTLNAFGNEASTPVRYRSTATASAVAPVIPTALFWDTAASKLYVSTTNATIAPGPPGSGPVTVKPSRIVWINDQPARTWTLFAGDSDMWGSSTGDNLAPTSASIEPMFMAGVSTTSTNLVLYFSETNRHRIRFVNTTTNKVGTLAGASGIDNWMGDNSAPGISTKLRLPGPIAIYSNILYCRELGSVNIIRIIPLDGSGTVTTLRLSSVVSGFAALPVTSVSPVTPAPGGPPLLSLEAAAAIGYGISYEPNRGWLLSTFADVGTEGNNPAQATAIYAIACKPSCPAAKVCDSYGSVLGGCPEHRYCAGNNFQDFGLTLAPLCPAGTYCAENSTAPTQCERGYQCLQEQRPAVCPGGRFCPAGTGINPAVCAMGILCPPGSYDANGSPEGGPTPPGTFSDTPGRAMPAGSISPGYYGLAGATSIFGTAPCGPGTWCGAGSGSPTKCAAGTWSNTTKRYNPCEPCPLGTFNPGEGSTTPSDCAPCPEGLTTTVTGATSPSQCIFVPYECPPGTQASIASPRKAADCVPLVCGVGLEDAHSSCRGCPKGKFRPSVQRPCAPCNSLQGPELEALGSAEGVVCPGLLARPLPPADKLIERIKAKAKTASGSQGGGSSSRRLAAAAYTDDCVAISSFQTKMSNAAVAAQNALASAGDNGPQVAAIASIAGLTGLVVVVVALVSMWAMRRADDESEAEYLEVVERLQHTSTAAKFGSSSTSQSQQPAAGAAPGGSSGDVSTTNPIAVATESSSSSAAAAPAKSTRKYRVDTKIRRFVRWLFLRVDLFSFHHEVPIFGWPRKVRTILGGACSVLAVITFLAVCAVLVTQRAFNNVLTAVSLDGLGPVEFNSLASAAARTNRDTNLNGLNVIITAAGGTDYACAAPTSWSFTGLYSGAFTLQSTACGPALAQHVFSCQGCIPQAGASLSLQLDWSCQAMMLQVFSVSASGEASLRNATASAFNMTTLPSTASADDVSLLTTISWTLQSLLGLQADAINDTRARGLRLLQSLVSSSGIAVSPSAFVPAQAAVNIAIDLSPLPLFSLTTLSEKITPAALLASMGGMLFVVSLFALSFSKIEPRVVAMLPGSGAKIALMANFDTTGVEATPLKKLKTAATAALRQRSARSVWPSSSSSARSVSSVRFDDDGSAGSRTTSANLDKAASAGSLTAPRGFSSSVRVAPAPAPLVAISSSSALLSASTSSSSPSSASSPTSLLAPLPVPHSSAADPSAPAAEEDVITKGPPQ